MEFGTYEGKTGIIAFLAVLALMEAAWIIFRRKESYPWAEAAASFGVTFLKRIIDLFTAGIVAGILFWAYEYRIMTLEVNSVAMLALLFFSVEFCYYWNHRFGHEIRWLWATHGVHHTPNHMNLSVASRLGVTSLISGKVLFFLPLAWLGFHPVSILVTLAAGLIYQIWIHNGWIGKLGFLEGFINTPSNHRVHHASNPEYLDKNHGGVLMIYDRIFGTYQAERDDITIVYGTVTPVTTNNPFKIAFFEWINMAKDVAKADNMKDVFGYLFRHPGWSPHRQQSEKAMDRLDEKQNLA